MGLHDLKFRLICFVGSVGFEWMHLKSENNVFSIPLFQFQCDGKKIENEIMLWWTDDYLVIYYFGVSFKFSLFIAWTIMHKR